MKITLEQRAIAVSVLANFGAGMVFVILLSPEKFIESPIAYYLVLPMSVLLFCTVGAINYLYLKHGLSEGFKKSGRNKQ